MEIRKITSLLLYFFILFFLQKMLLKNAGMKGQKTVFLLTDTQIKEEAFLEDVDSVLNTGEVPNLFAMDEKQEIMEVMSRHCTCFSSHWFTL